MTSPASRPVLACYDGSANADRAVDLAAALFPDRLAIVVTVWQPASVTLTQYAIGGAPVLGDLQSLDREVAQAAAALAAKGAERALAAGVAAESVGVESSGGVWQGITETADARDAAVIVIGRRGLSALRSALLGSVSHAVVQHARRPVLIAPPEE